MKSTDYNNWNLHDAELVDLRYIWDELKLVIRLKAFLYNSKEYVDCKIKCEGVSNIHIPHKYPWDDSKYINKFHIEDYNGHKICEIEMISGDHIKIVLDKIELIYEDINSPKGTLSNLLGKEMEKTNFESHLVNTCSDLYNLKPINEYTIEELRIMISQQLGLDYLIPLAIEELEHNVLCEGNLFPGDLLKSIVSIDKDYWEKNPNYRLRLQRTIIEHVDLITDIAREFLKI